MVIYAPSLALETVTGLGKWASVWLTGSISIFYTSIGGLKAVVWTDTIQLIVMLSGFLGILIKGTVDHGTTTIFDTFRLGGRNVWDDFMFDPRYRHTFWSIVLGGVFGTWGNSYCSTQSMVQRMLACKDKRDMKIALYLSLVFLFLILSLTGLAGAVLFQYNKCCDPLKAGHVDTYDQMLPYLAVNLFQEFPGVAGLYIAGAYSGALSTISSGINSMTTVIITDFIKPYENSIFKNGIFKCFTPNDRFYLIFGKTTAVILGLMCIAFTYIASDLGGILQASLSINNIIGGANFAIFVLGFTNPYANRWGAHFGFLIGLCFSGWIYYGSNIYPTPQKFTKRLETELIGCYDYLNKTEEWCPIPKPEEDVPGIANLYYISYIVVGHICLTP